MAAPESVRIGNLTAVFKLNKELSDDVAPLLEWELRCDRTDQVVLFLWGQQQGINWLVRKVMASATPTIDVNEYLGQEGKPHLDVVMTATAGIKGKDERVLDWEPITRTNGPLGLVENQSRLYTKAVDMFSDASDEDRAFLNGEILAAGDSVSSGWLEEGHNLQTVMVSKTGGWVSEQTWGFETINGSRLHTRRGIVTRVDGKEARRARLVYDFVSCAGS